MHLQESGEMYLETLYILSQKSNFVRQLDIAEYMNYSKPSVNRAIGLLKTEGILNLTMKAFYTLQMREQRLPKRPMNGILC